MKNIAYQNADQSEKKHAVYCKQSGVKPKPIVTCVGALSRTWCGTGCQARLVGLLR